jgi:hypothetical protein
MEILLNLNPILRCNPSRASLQENIEDMVSYVLTLNKPLSHHILGNGFWGNHPPVRHNLRPSTPMPYTDLANSAFTGWGVNSTMGSPGLLITQELHHRVVRDFSLSQESQDCLRGFMQVKFHFISPLFDLRLTLLMPDHV